MDIPNINNNNINPQNRADKAESNKHINKAGEASKGDKASSSVQADKVSISNSGYDSELKFARAEYDKFQQQSLEDLKQIKQNIDKGVYEQDSIQLNVSRSMQGEIAAVEAAEHQTGVSEATEGLSAERKEQLLNDSAVLDEIAGKLINDLSQL